MSAPPPMPSPKRSLHAAHRRSLPAERASVTHEFSIGGFEGTLVVGLFDDGMPGEIFLHNMKLGSSIQGFVDSWCIMVSIALQYGVPLQVIVEKYRYMNFEPNGFTSRGKVCSIPSYFVTWLEEKFLQGFEKR